MRVKVKIFAGLRERLGFAERELIVTDGVTVADAWREISDQADLPQGVLTAVNLAYVRPQHRLADGDEVAFFPPVTGG
jgi:molybdopterin synthase sulfur carrier subunit